MSMAMTAKAERVRAKAQQHPLNEHELDLFFGTSAIDATALAAADADARSLASSSLVAPDAVGFQQAQYDDPHMIQFLPGMVLLRRFLSPSEQQRLVDDAQALGLSPSGFYKPTYASGAKCRLHQMCLGKHWNVITEQYDSVRSNHNSAPVLPLSAHWRALAVKSLDAARALDPRVIGQCRAMTPDICVVNYYKKAGRNGMHVDKDESAEALTLGSPVVSFSIGAAAEFAFIDHYPQGSEAVPVVRLESGDVLVFGGPSRRVVHALTRVFPNTEPSWLRMRAGRLNLTFREYQPVEA